METNYCHIGDALEVLPRLVESGLKVQCVVTSPPYYRLRDYGWDKQIGLERTPEIYLDMLTGIFAKVHNVLADDGVLWLNIDDSYDDKCLMGLPWRLVSALQEYGWILRANIIWVKPNPMPESVKDRPTHSYEHIFLLSKQVQYYYDSEAVREPVAGPQHPLALSFARKVNEPERPGKISQHRPERAAKSYGQFSRNLRDVWVIPPQRFNGPHYSTFPEELAQRCILAGSRPGDIVLDPFMGAGTVAVVAERTGRKWVGVEINPEYVEIQNERLDQVAPLMKSVGL